MEKQEKEEESERRLKYYSSSHQILLVGEGDFSFSLCLAKSFQSASNIVATSLDQYDVVREKYSEAKTNLAYLEKMGATILHGVDATKIQFHTDLKMRKFDRIIFNFPHAGWCGKEDNLLQLRLHRNLVKGFFGSASRMLRPNGEIHVNHKTTKPYCCWKLEELASSCSLTLLECVKFERMDYPGYKNRRGHGASCNDSFRLGECSTFKFGIVGTRRYKKQEKMGCAHEQSLVDMIGTQDGNPRLFSRIDPLQRYHTMTMQGIPMTQDVNPRPLTRSNHPSAYHPMTVPNILERQNGNPGVFNRSNRTANMGYPNGHNTIAMQELPVTRHHDLEVFSRNDYSLDAGCTPMTSTATVPYSSRSSSHPQTVRISSECLSIFDCDLSHNKQMFARTECDFPSVAQEFLSNDYEMYMNEQPGRNMHGQMRYLQQLVRSFGENPPSVAREFLSNDYEMYMNEQPGRNVRGNVQYLQQLVRSFGENP